MTLHTQDPTHTRPCIYMPYNAWCWTYMTLNIYSLAWLPFFFTWLTVDGLGTLVTETLQFLLKFMTSSDIYLHLHYVEQNKKKIQIWVVWNVSLFQTRISKLLMVYLFLWFPVSLNALPCSVVLPPTLNLLKYRTLIFYPVFLHGYPSFPYPDCGSLHHDTLSISFFPESPNNLPIYQSFYLLYLSLICIFWSLYHIP